MSKYCASCGTPLGEKAKFCTVCGARVAAAPPAAVGGDVHIAPPFSPQSQPRRLPRPVLVGIIAGAGAILAAAVLALTVSDVFGIFGADKPLTAAELLELEASSIGDGVLDVPLLPTDTATPESEPTAMPDPNLVNAMSEAEYRKLNEYFMLFESNYNNLGTDLTNMLDDERNIVNVVLADEGVPVKQVSEAGGWVHETPDSIVEERLTKYFGIQNVNHDGYGIDEFGIWTGYNNGIYRSWNYDGAWQDRWPNAISLTDNGNGTLTAIVDIYHCFDYIPQNWYQHTDDWILEYGFTIADKNDTSDEFIYNVGQLSIIIRPYEDSYQIVSIDGKNVPKALFSDYVAPPPASVAPTLPERRIVADIEGEVGQIRELWLADRNAISSGEYRKESVRSGITSFWDGDELKMIEVVSGTDGISHLRIYQYENQKLIFAFWEGEDAHRQYYADGYMFRWRYTPKGGNYIDYDNDTNNVEYLSREQTAHSEADALFAEAY